jgi:hypothetical protein
MVRGTLIQSGARRHRSSQRARDVAPRDVLDALLRDARRRFTPQWKAEADALRAEV